MRCAPDGDARANAGIYTGYCNDVLDRPTQIVSAINNAPLKIQSTFSYNDTARTVTVTRDKNAYGDNLLKGVSFYEPAAWWRSLTAAARAAPAIITATTRS